MKETSWVGCPICHNKTRIKVRMDTELKNFPLFCPKCKQETLIHVKQLNISVIREPDAYTHGAIGKTRRGYFVTLDNAAVAAFRERYLASVEEEYYHAKAKIET